MWCPIVALTSCLLYSYLDSQWQFFALSIRDHICFLDSEEFDANFIDQVQRPHLDGSSSDSDNDQSNSAGATNFARTNIGTLRHTNLRFNIPQELERLNHDDIPGENS